MKDQIAKIVFLAISVLTTLDSAEAVNYYLSPTGNDAKAGTSTASAWRTLQKAFNTVKGGETVFFLAGTYSGAVARNLHPATGQWITFKPYPGAKVRINTASGPISLPGASYLVFEGLEITDLTYNLKLPFSCNIVTSQTCKNMVNNLPKGSYGIGLGGTYYGNATTDTHHIIIRNNNIHHNTGYGIKGVGHNPVLFPTSIGNHDITIEKNHIHHNGYAGLREGYGTYVCGNNFVIRNNDLHDNSGNNIRIGNIPANQRAVNFVLENNLSYRAQAPFLHSSGNVRTVAFGMALYGLEGGIIRNNVVYDNKGTGIWSVNVNASKPTLIYNNTVTGNDQMGLELSGRSIARNNIAYQNAKSAQTYQIQVRGTSLAEKNLVGGNSFQVGTSESGVEQNNLKNSNPFFVSPATKNFRIQAASPAVNSGLTLLQVLKDFDGQARPSGAYDIGAYEFVSGLPKAPMGIRMLPFE